MRRSRVSRHIYAFDPGQGSYMRQQPALRLVKHQQEAYMRTRSKESPRACKWTWQLRHWPIRSRTPTKLNAGRFLVAPRTYKSLRVDAYDLMEHEEVCCTRSSIAGFAVSLFEQSRNVTAQGQSLRGNMFTSTVANG